MASDDSIDAALEVRIKKRLEDLLGQGQGPSAEKQEKAGEVKSPGVPLTHEKGLDEVIDTGSECGGAAKTPQTPQPNETGVYKVPAKGRGYAGHAKPPKTAPPHITESDEKAIGQYSSPLAGDLKLRIRAALQEANHPRIGFEEYKKKMARVVFLMGFYSYAAGKKGEAVAHFMDALKYDPFYADPHIEIVDYYLAEQDFVSAARRCLAALEYLPNHPKLKDRKDLIEKKFKRKITTFI